MASINGIFRGETKRLRVTPTADLPCGAFVFVGGIVGVTTSRIAAGEQGEIQIDGDYDLAVTAGTATIGAVVKATVVTLAGAEVAGVPVGYAIEDVTGGATVRIKLVPDFLLTGADGYSASSTYAVGDVVKYNGAYYVCKTAIGTAEAWTASKWMKIGDAGSSSVTPAA